MNQKDKFYTKANAAKLFKERNLDSGKTVVFKIVDLFNSWHLVTKKFGFGARITIRFSEGHRVGLPTVFTTLGEKTIEEVIRIGSEYEYVIIQDYIEVQNSFELCCHNSGWVVEHVPGMWESSENTPPDIMSYESSGALSLHAWSGDRPMRKTCFGNDKTFNEVKFSHSDWKNIFRKTNCIYDLFYHDFKGFFPLIIHFVISDKGRWRCLNIRDGRGLRNINAPPVLPYYKVSSVKELSMWSGDRPILVDFSLRRGRESELLELSGMLPRGVPVYVKGGMLSHPAIVLRSMGVNIQSAKGILSPHQNEDGYSRMDLQIDIGEEPIGRIFAEPAVVEDDNFHVVYDREPIRPGHLLLVTKAFAPSIADAGLGDALDVLIKRISEGLGQDWVMWERGRAQFCTSNLTTSHAHCHFLPLPRAADNLLASFAEVPSKEFSTARDALEWAASTDCEYLMLHSGTGRTLVYAPSPIGHDQKRLVRSRISELYAEKL